MKKLKKNVRLKSLDKAYQPRTRKELIDYDYIDKLSPEEKELIAQFTDEYYGGAVGKTKTGRIKAGHIHNTKALAKDCYDRNNRQNNDVLGVSKANSLVSEITQELNNKDGWYITNSELTEDALIASIENTENESELTREEFEQIKDQLTPEMLLYYLSIYDLE